MSKMLNVVTLELEWLNPFIVICFYNNQGIQVLGHELTWSWPIGLPSKLALMSWERGVGRALLSHGPETCSGKLLWDSRWIPVTNHQQLVTSVQLGLLVGSCTCSLWVSVTLVLVFGYLTFVPGPIPWCVGWVISAWVVAVMPLLWQLKVLISGPASWARP